MNGVNKVILVGALARDPEVRNMQNGSSLVNLSVGTSESWRDKQSGDRREKTEWHRVVIFNANLAKIAQQYLKKGSKVYLEGKLQTRKWQDQSGADRYSTEIVLENYGGTLVMLGDIGDRGSQGNGGRAAADPGRGQGQGPAGFDDGIPFSYEWR